MEIIYHPELNKYQLLLQQNIIDDLGLSGEDGKPPGIFHENKLNLEWLYRDIGQRHSEVVELMQSAEKSRKRRLIAAGVLFAISMAVVLFSKSFAVRAGYLPAGFKLIGVLMGIFSALFFIQNYFLKGMTGRRGLVDSLKTIELQREIIEKYRK